MESILAGLLTSTSSIVAKSSLRLKRNFVEAAPLLTVVCGTPGSNKSGIIRLMKTSYQKMEQMWNNVFFNNDLSIETDDESPKAKKNFTNKNNKINKTNKPPTALNNSMINCMYFSLMSFVIKF
jgi:broad-specificity NMP kinase